MKSVALLFAVLCIAACRPTKEARQWASDATGGNPGRGKSAITKFGCVACHTIDGISSEALVGPPLTHMASRSYVAGNLENNAANITRFIQHPRQIHNDTAMPEIGLKDQDARDIAAYLYQYK